jgi:hypothetical protein
LKLQMGPGQSLSPTHSINGGFILCCVYTQHMSPKTYVRKIKQGARTKYAEVWGERRGKKVIQHHVRYLGTDPDHPPPPTSFAIETVHFGYLAQLILRDALVADDLHTMLKAMGQTAPDREVRGIVIRYDLGEKKLRLQLVLARK